MPAISSRPEARGALPRCEGRCCRAAAAFAASSAKIAVICSTDKQYTTVVAELAPMLEAAGARTVILAGDPGQSEAAYRAVRTRFP